MHTYVKTEQGTHAAIRASRSEVRALPEVASGKWSIVKSTRALRAQALLNVNVRVHRILPDGRLGLV